MRQGLLGLRGGARTLRENPRISRAREAGAASKPVQLSFVANQELLCPSNNQPDDLLALIPQLGPDRVFMLPAEAADHLLKMDRYIHRLLVDRQMLPPGQ